MEKLIIFGNSEFSEHIYYQIKNNYNVSGFTVDKEFKTFETFCDLPLVNFENIEHNYPPSEYKLFIALGYSNMNKLREDKFKQAKEKGYNLISFIHPSCTIANNVEFGENCFIFENTVIQPFVKIKNNVIIYTSSSICHHSNIEDNTFIGSNVCINGYVTIKKNSFIGASATIRNHITIEQETLIGAGCTILENTKPNQVYKSPKPEILCIESNQIENI